MLNAFGLSAPGGGETGTPKVALNTWGGIVAGGGGNGSGGYPKAFVNLLVFDINYKFLDIGWDQINGGEQVGAEPKAAHDYMMQEYTAREEGYIYVYVSNENGTLVEVYFDDVVVTQTKSNLIQYNEYYPFGQQTAGSWTRENTLGNNFLANGGTELNSTSNLYDLEYRNYDQVIGRMNGVDPMTTKYASLTPYNFSFNDPVTFTDVNGADPIGNWLEEHRDLETWFNNTMPSVAMDPGGGGFGSSGYYNSVMGGYGPNGWTGSYSLTSIIQYYAPDFRGPVYLGLDADGYAIHGLPTQIEKAGGAQSYYNIVYSRRLGMAAFNMTPEPLSSGQGMIGYFPVVSGRLDLENAMFVAVQEVPAYTACAQPGCTCGSAETLAGVWFIALVEPTPIGEGVALAATLATAWIVGPQIIDDVRQAILEAGKFKGGKQSGRDRDFGLPAGFWEWWHRGGGKKENGGRDVGYGEGEIPPAEALDQWEGLGRPSGSKSKGK